MTGSMENLQTHSTQLVLLSVGCNTKLVSISDCLGSHDDLTSLELPLEIEMASDVVSMEVR